MSLTFNYNWFLGSFVIAIVTANSQNSGKGKSSSTVTLPNISDSYNLIIHLQKTNRK